jgi:hypothetical protein
VGFAVLRIEVETPVCSTTLAQNYDADMSSMHGRKCGRRDFVGLGTLGDVLGVLGIDTETSGLLHNI